MLSPLSPFMEKETEAGDGGEGSRSPLPLLLGVPTLPSTLSLVAPWHNSSSLWGWVGDGAGKQDFLGRSLWLLLPPWKFWCIWTRPGVRRRPRSASGSHGPKLRLPWGPCSSSSVPLRGCLPTVPAGWLYLLAQFCS